MEDLIADAKNNLGLIISILSGLGVIFSLYNDKSREFILRRINLSKNKSELKKEMTLADDEILDTYINRINNMASDFDELMNKMSQTQKENLETRAKNVELQLQLEIFKKKVENNCNNNCII